MLNDPFLVALAERLAKVRVVLAELNGLMAGKQCEREPATCFQSCEASAEASACSVATLAPTFPLLRGTVIIVSRPPAVRDDTIFVSSEMGEPLMEMRLQCL